MLAMAGDPQGLTWRRVHDAVRTDDRVRARAAFTAIIRSGRLHPVHHGRQSRWFATADLAAAWQPPASTQRKRSSPRPTETPAAAPCAPQHTAIAGYTHDPRYQLAPGAIAPRLFAALPMGRYLDE